LTLLLVGGLSFDVLLPLLILLPLALLLSTTI